VRTEARQRVRSAKQVSKLSLGQNKDGQNITTPGIVKHQSKACFKAYHHLA